MFVPSSLGFLNPALLGVGLDADTVALIERMTSKPNSARTLLMDRVVTGLKSAGIWPKLDALYMMAAHDAQSAGLNWISSNYTLVPVNSPTFTADRGYQGDGATSYLDTGINFSPVVTKATRDSHSFGVFQRLSQTELGVADMGNALLSLNSFRTGMTMGIRSAFDTLDTPATTVSGASGAYTVSRTGPTAYSVYHGLSTTVVNNRATASTNLSTIRKILVGAFDSSGGVSGYSARPYCSAWLGEGLSNAEVFTLHAIVQDYNIAVGAA